MAGVLLALALLTAWRGIELHGHRSEWNAYQAECGRLEANDRAAVARIDAFINQFRSRPNGGNGPSADDFAQQFNGGKPLKMVAPESGEQEWIYEDTANGGQARVSFDEAGACYSTDPAYNRARQLQTPGGFASFALGVSFFAGVAGIIIWCGDFLVGLSVLRNTRADRIASRWRSVKLAAVASYLAWMGCKSWPGWYPFADHNPFLGISEIMLAIAVCWLIRAYLEARPRDPMQCAKCGYNLTGNVSGRCPECGSITEASVAKGISAGTMQ